MIYLELLITFMKIGLFTIGGGYAMLPMIEDEVIKKGWMSTEELINFIAVSESTPGPFAVNVATYIGTRTGGIAGALCATAGVLLPSFFIVLIAAVFYTSFRKNRIVGGLMSGLRPAVICLIAAAAVSVGQTVFFPDGFGIGAVTSYGFICSAAIFALMLFLGTKKINPVFIIILSAVGGMIAGYAEQLFIA
jgi:chromate transporter